MAQHRAATIFLSLTPMPPFRHFIPNLNKSAKSESSQLSHPPMSDTDWRLPSAEIRDWRQFAALLIFSDRCFDFSISRRVSAPSSRTFAGFRTHLRPRACTAISRQPQPPLRKPY